MLQFILRRLGLVIPTFIGITLLTFAFVHMIPGDPVMIMAGERGISPERHAQLLAELGLGTMQLLRHLLLDQFVA